VWQARSQGSPKTHCSSAAIWQKWCNDISSIQYALLKRHTTETKGKMINPGK
jgi:hypothetical protein